MCVELCAFSERTWESPKLSPLADLEAANQEVEAKTALNWMLEVILTCVQSSSVKNSRFVGSRNLKNYSIITDS